jgi:hypothetical protein
VQLVARQLDHERVETRRIADRIEHRDADVPRRSCAHPAGDEHRRGQLRCRGLAVGAGDADPVGGLPIGAHDLVAHAPRQFDITPDRDAALLCPEQQRVIGVVAGRHDHELGIERGKRFRDGLLVGVQVEARADDGEQLDVFVGRLRGDDEHLGTELDEGVGDREPRDADPEHRDAQPTPVGAPAGEARQISH